MKTQLQKHLQTLAPSVSIETHWEHDPYLYDIRKDCDGFDDENPDDWQAWQSEIRATAICGGEEITGSAYLGGTWERAGDNPAFSNPEISGYELQMTVEALEELRNAAPPESTILGDQIAAALDYLKAPTYAVRARNGSGYLATQGREYWFQDTPDGWALHTTEESARDAMERCHSALGTSTPEGGEIVYA